MTLSYKPSPIRTDPSSKSRKRAHQVFELQKQQAKILFCFVQQGEGTFILNYTPFAFIGPALFCIPAEQFHCFVQADINRPFRIHKTWIKTSELQASLVSLFQENPPVQALMSKKVASILDHPLEPYFSYSNSKSIGRFREFLMQFNPLSSQKLYSQSIPTNDLETKLSIQKIVEFTAFHYRKPFSIYELAELMNQTPLNVCRFFKEHCGQSYVHFLRTLRLEQAQCLMQMYPLKSCRNIALEVGFDNTAQLSRAFKNEMNLSVSQYRKNKCRQDSSASKFNKKRSAASPSTRN